MKLSVFCSLQVGVRMEDTGVSAECRSHLSLLSPPPHTALLQLELRGVLDFSGGGGYLFP